MANLAQEASTSKLKDGTAGALIDMKLEAVVLPVSNVERAKDFYLRMQ